MSLKNKIKEMSKHLDKCLLDIFPLNNAYFSDEDIEDNVGVLKFIYKHTSNDMIELFDNIFDKYISAVDEHYLNDISGFKSLSTSLMSIGTDFEATYIPDVYSCTKTVTITETIKYIVTYATIKTETYNAIPDISKQSCYIILDNNVLPNNTSETEEEETFSFFDYKIKINAGGIDTIIFGINDTYEYIFDNFPGDSTYFEGVEFSDIYNLYDITYLSPELLNFGYSSDNTSTKTANTNNFNLPVVNSWLLTRYRDNSSTLAYFSLSQASSENKYYLNPFSKSEYASMDDISYVSGCGEYLDDNGDYHYVLIPVNFYIGNAETDITYGHTTGNGLTLSLYAFYVGDPGEPVPYVSFDTGQIMPDGITISFDITNSSPSYSGKIISYNITPSQDIENIPLTLTNHKIYTIEENETLSISISPDTMLIFADEALLASCGNYSVEGQIEAKYSLSNRLITIASKYAKQTNTITETEYSDLTYTTKFGYYTYSELQPIVDYITATYYDKWKRLYDTFILDYDALAPFSMSVDEKIEDTMEANTDASINQDYSEASTNAKTGTDTTSRDTTNTRTLTGTDKTTHTGTDTTDTEGNRYGVLSSPIPSSDNSETVTHDTVDTLTHNTTDKSVIDETTEVKYNSSNSLTDSGNTATSNKTDYNRTNNITRGTTRKGNIGNITNQQLIAEQRALLRERMCDIIFADLDEVLTRKKYKV